ncbi:FAD binding domain-containing protein [Histoplasma ohiense]|nr:FAD binding domain-containing protein [Histoplasma ohiense (nom. inval.)]
MNTVVEFDVVLANGDIVKASNCQNTDLFNVLRGGGNAYGIVTTYTLKTHKIGKVWGGNLTISADKSNEVLAAVRDFTEYYPDDKAAIIATRNIGIENQLDIWLIFLFYDGETAPAGTFDNFTNIGPILNTAKTQSYFGFGECPRCTRYHRQHSRHGS